ncbi:hypothetical protein PS6_003608 [Mucor atramentarius]
MLNKCASYGGEGHKRRTHRNCPLNPINAADTATAPEDVHCLFCYRVEHNRTNHWDCARNPLNLEDDRIARSPDLPEVARQSIGSMDVTCSSCGAFMWIGEREIRSSVSSPVFQMCYAEGEALLAPPRTLAPTIVDLLTRNDAISKEFKHDIR